MIALDMPQRSAEWHQARVGVLTASVVDALYATRKDKKESAARRDLRFRLALERITGESAEEPFTSGDTDRGAELEAAALAAYEAHVGALVQPVGFVRHETEPIGCSPDGFVGDDGLVQIKCPRAANHFETVRRKAVPEDYIPQLTHEVWVTGRTWVDFVSYCPQMTALGCGLVVLRFVPDAATRSSHALVVAQFLREVGDLETELRQEIGR